MTFTDISTSIIELFVICSIVLLFIISYQKGKRKRLLKKYEKLDNGEKNIAKGIPKTSRGKTRVREKTKSVGRFSKPSKHSVLQTAKTGSDGKGSIGSGKDTGRTGSTGRTRSSGNRGIKGRFKRKTTK